MTTSDEAVDVKRLFLFVRDVSFCQRSDAVLAFVRQALASPSSARQALGAHNAVLLCAETHTHAAPLLLLSERDAAQIGALSDGTVAVTLANRPNSNNSNSSSAPPMRMRADSELVVLAASFRVVVSLDVSPSVASVDAESSEVLFDALLRAVERTAFALLDAFRLDGGDFQLEFRPRLYLSVVAQMGLADTFWPLVQCALLSEASVVDTLLAVRRRLERTETRAASRALRIARHGSANADLAATIQNAAFVLKLMPDSARSLLLLVCDGAVALPDTSAYDNLLMLLNREAISCSSVQIGAGYAPSGAFGYVPDCDVLRHLANATHGCFFTARRLAAVCNRDTHPAYADYVSRHTGLDANARSRYVDHDHASQYSSGTSLQRWRGEARSMSTASSALVEAAAGVPGNLLQQRLLWNAFSPARRYFAYNDAYQRNGAGAGSQLDGPLLAALPRHPFYFEALTSAQQQRRHPCPPEPAALAPPASFAEARTFLPVDAAPAASAPARAVQPACPLFGTTSIDAEIVVPSSAGLNRLIAVNHPFPWCDPPAPVPLQRESLRVYELNCSVAAVADVRLREGFLVDDMQRANRLTLLLPWVANVVIVYSVIAKKEADIYTAPVRVDLSVYACDEFLNEFAFARANPQAPSATPLHVHRLLTFVAELLQTDRLLQQLCTRIGIGPSLASAPPNDMTRSLVAEGTRRRVARTLWRTLASLAAMSWHRWLRIERLELHLAPSLDALRPADYSPFAERAQQPAADQALVTDVSALHIGFARANEVLLRFCAQWATFVHSPKLFARFVSSDGSAIAPDQAPQLLSARCFCVLRLHADADHVGLLSAQFAMHGLTPAGRQRVLDDFVSGLRQMAAEHTEPLGATIDTGDAADALQVALEPAQLPVVQTSRRAVTPLLVRYAPIQLAAATAAAAAAGGEASALHPLALLRPTVPLLEAHMHWRRRVWRIRNPLIRALLVDALIHERMRDGLQLCAAGGVFTLARTLPMTVDRRAPSGVAARLATMPAMLQYVVFAAAPDLVATEVWLEPQHGALVGGSAAPRRTAGVRLFNDVERAFHDADRELVWALVTFDVVMLTIQSGHLSRAEQVALLQHQTANASSATLSSQGLQLEPTPVSLGALVRCASANVVEFESLRRPLAAASSAVAATAAAADDDVSLVQLRNLVERHDRGELKDVAPAPSGNSAPLTTQSDRPVVRRGSPAATSTAALPALSAVASKRNELSRFSSVAQQHHHHLSSRATHKSPAAAIGIVGKAPAIDPAKWPAKMLRAALHRALTRSAAASSLVLWGAFGQFVAFASDCEIPPQMHHASKELAPFVGARCFAKRVGGTTVMIAFLARVPDEELERAAQQSDGARAAPLRLHAFECARDQLVVSHMLTPPRLPFLREGAGANIAPFVPPVRFSAEGDLFLRNLSVGFERCFARTVYTQLRRGHTTSADDVARALAVCRPYATEVDITQYLRVQHKHFLMVQRGERAGSERAPHTHHNDALPAHDDDDDEDEPAPSRDNSTGSTAGEPLDDTTRARMQKRADDARADFRTVLREFFRPLADCVQPSDATAQFADIWVYAPAVQPRSGRRLRSSTGGGGDGDDAVELGVSGSSAVVNNGGGDDDAASTAGDVLDSEWAADVNEEDSAGATADAPVHIDVQTASGAWPMPLFVRIERVFRSGAAATTITKVNDVPTALDDDVLSQPFDYVALRFVALTLPPYEPLMPGGAEPAAAESDAPTTWQVLPNTMQAALKTFTAAVNGFLSSQILDVLRYRRPLSGAILDMAQYHMARVGAKLVEFSVPLHFISPADGLAMFPSQLTSTFFLTLRKVGDIYCVVEPRSSAADSVDVSRPETPPAPVPTSVAPTTPPDAILPLPAAPRTTLHGSWVVRKGSAFSPVPPSSKRMVPHSPGSPPRTTAAPATPPASSDDGVFHIPFWLLMRINEQEVRFSFVGPDSLGSIERSRFCTDLRAGARRVCERVNQLYLLAQVHEMRTSSNLQILSVDKRELRKSRRREREKSDSDVAGGAAAAASSVAGGPAKRSIFFPGQFVCPQVYAIQLPLHPRLAPDVAMRALIEAALHPFSVTNRKNVFVYREQNGNVFYLELSERMSSVRKVPRMGRSTSTSAAPSRPSSPPADEHALSASAVAAALRRNTDTSGPSAPPTFEDSDDSEDDELEESDLISIVAPEGAATPVLATPPLPVDAGGGGGESGATPHLLVLRVFGVEQPTAEITVQMRDLLYSKLSEITLKLMSSLLARNPNLRLSVDDVQFLQGVDAHEPGAAEVPPVACRLRIGVPAAIGGLGLWLAFVRAHLQHRQFLATANAPRAAFFESKRRAELGTMSPPVPVRHRSGFVDSGSFSAVNSSGGGSHNGIVSLQQHTQPLIFNHVAAPGAARGVSQRTRSYGEGVALVYVRVRDDADQLITRVECSEREQRMSANQFESVGGVPLFTAAGVRAALDGALRHLRVESELGAAPATDDADDDSGGVLHRYSAACKHHWLVFDIWQRGHVHVEAFARGLFEQVRHAIVAYVFETYLVAPQPSLCTPFWIRAVQQLAQRASESTNDAFADIDVPVALPTHAVVQFARDVAARIGDIVPQLQPAIYRLPRLDDSSADERALQPLAPAELAQWRAEPWRDAADLPRLLITTTLGGSGSPTLFADEVMYEAIKLDANPPFHRRPFALVCVSRERLRVVTYNWRSERNAALRDAMSGLTRWVGMRRSALDSILLQKLGLTHALRSELLAGAVDADAPVPSVEPLLIYSAPHASAVAAMTTAATASPAAPSDGKSLEPAASAPNIGSAVAAALGGANSGASSGTNVASGVAVVPSGDEKKPSVNDNSQMISDLIAIGGSAVRRVSSRHDTVAAAMAARRRGVAFGPPRIGAGGGVSSAPPPEKSAPPSAAEPPAATLADSQIAAPAVPERTGLAALLFHELLLRDELLGVAPPSMRLSTLIDPTQRHGSQFLKLAALVAQRCDAQRDVLRALSSLNRVGQGDRLSRSDLQRLLRSARRLECGSAPTPSAQSATIKRVRDIETGPAVTGVELVAASWNELARVGVSSEDATLLARAQVSDADVGWSTTQANRIADVVTKLLTDRHGLRVLTLTTRTQGETVVGVANVASERWLARSFGKRAAFLVHLTWTAAMVSLQTYLADSSLYLPMRVVAADIERERAALTDDTVHISVQAFLRSTMWDFAAGELREVSEARERAQAPIPPHEFVRLLQRHLDAASTRPTARQAGNQVVWAPNGRRAVVAAPAGARSVVVARLCAPVDGGVSAEDLLAYLSRRGTLPHLRSLAPLGIANAVALRDAISTETAAQLPASHEFSALAVVAAGEGGSRLALLLLATPVGEPRLGSAGRRELSMADACAQCLNDAHACLQSMLHSAAADYQRDRVWSLMTEPQQRRVADAPQLAPLTLADFVSVSTLLHAINLAQAPAASQGGEPRSLLRLGGAELADQLLRNATMRPWRDVMVLAAQRFGTVRKDGTVRRTCLFLANEAQPQLVVFDTACPDSLLLLSAGPPTTRGAANSGGSAPDLASALVQQRQAIDGARLSMCFRNPATAAPNDAEKQLANDFVQFLLACLWFRLAGRSIDAAAAVSPSSPTTPPVMSPPN